MQLISLTCVSVVVLIAFAACAFGADTSGKQLHDLFQREWDWTMQQHPVWASTLGDRRWNDKWDDTSLAAIEARHRHGLDTLKTLQAIDRAALSDPDKQNFD